MPVPSPILVSLDPGDTFLYAQWQNNPYIDIYNAYLLVVNTSDYTDIKYIYLTEEEALDEAMKIDNLLNGISYLVQYTQTQIVPDGVQGNSNTLSGSPRATPNPPTILNNNVDYPIVIQYNDASDQYDISLWVDYGEQLYEPPLEKTIFKIISELTPEIFSQEFTDGLSNISGYKNFTFTNLSVNNYAISCFNINPNGVGPLSNVIRLNVGNLPNIANITQVDSGLDEKLKVYVSTRQNDVQGYNIRHFNIYYAIDGLQPNWVLYDIPFNVITVTGDFVTAEGFINGLVNGQKYLVKAVAVNVNGDGSFGDEGRGVTAKQTTVSNVTITLGNANGGTVNANWDRINGTFGPTSYNYVLFNGDNIVIREGTVQTNSISLTGLTTIIGDEQVTLSVTPVDTVPSSTLPYWITPSLVNVVDNWVGETVYSDPYTVYDKPLPLTSIDCSDIGYESLTYTFVKPDSFSYNAPTKYTIELSTSNIFNSIVQIADIGPTSTTYTFTGLTNNTSYYARIKATNDYGSSATVSTGPNQPLLPIKGVSGLIGPLQNKDGNGLYSLSIDWDTFSQFGYTVVSYTINVYDGENKLLSTAINNPIQNVDEASYYNYNNATLGGTYIFGVIVNATINQSINSQINTQISSAEIKTNSYTIYDKPPPLTSFVCSEVGNNTLKYTFVTPVYSSFDAPTIFTIELSEFIEFNNIYESTNIGFDTNKNTYTYTFTGLTNNTNYYARIKASNNYGTNATVSTGPNQPLLPIEGVSGLVGPSQGSNPFSPETPDLYTLSIDWNAFSQPGYTLVNYTVKVYEDESLVSTETTTVASYTYNGTLGRTYAFGVFVNATINQSINSQINTQISSAELKTSVILVSGVPYIFGGTVVFGTQLNGKGTITFEVDGKYSKLLGLFTLILPENKSSVTQQSDVFQTQPDYYYPLTTEDSAGRKTYTANLDYTIPNTGQAYLIYAINSIGSSYVASGLTVGGGLNTGSPLR